MIYNGNNGIYTAHPTDTQENIEAVNAGLSAACADSEVTFIDTNTIFRLQDGSINDGYLLNDGIHLKRPATNKLAKCLDLKIKNTAEGVCKDIAQDNRPA